MDSTRLSSYLQLYAYLQVLSEEQIVKLRNVAVGILEMSAFSKEEIDQLENKTRTAEREETHETSPFAG